MLFPVMKKRFLLVGIVIGGLLLGAGCASSNKQASGDQLFQGQTTDDAVAPALSNSGAQIQVGAPNQNQIGPQ